MSSLANARLHLVGARDATGTQCCDACGLVLSDPGEPGWEVGGRVMHQGQVIDNRAVGAVFVIPEDTVPNVPFCKALRSET